MQKRRFHGRFWLSSMSARQPGPYDSTARKWLALAERRQAHLVALSDSGRWRHYYSPAELDDEMRRAAALRAQWARLAGLPLHEAEADLDVGAAAD